MKTSGLLTLSVIMTSSLFADPAWNYNGHIEAGAGYLSTKNALSTSDKERILTLDRKADTESTGIPAIGFSVHALSSDKTIDLFLRDKEYKEIEAGIAYMKNSHTFTFSVYKPMMATEVWKNPYDTTNTREETEAEETGASFSYKRQLSNSYGITLTHSAKQTDIDEDELQAISQDLARDSILHEGAVDFEFGMYSAGLSYAYKDADGDINSYTGPGVRLGIKNMISERLYGQLDGKVSAHIYEKENPYFNETREDTAYSLFGSLRYMQPFEWKNSYAFFHLLYSQTQSNVTFFDQETQAAILGIGYKF